MIVQFYTRIDVQRLYYHLSLGLKIITQCFLITIITKLPHNVMSELLTLKMSAAITVNYITIYCTFSKIVFKSS